MWFNLQPYDQSQNYFYFLNSLEYLFLNSAKLLNGQQYSLGTAD